MGLLGLSVHDDSVRLILVKDAAEVEPACKELEDSGLLGFDLEWYASKKGQPQRKVAVCQLCDGKVCVLLSITSLGGVPDALARLLMSKRLAAVRIAEDIKRLCQGYPETAPAIPASNVIDLLPLFGDVFRVARWPKKKNGWSLEKITERVVQKKLNKKLVVVWKVNWENWPLAENAVLYAANDAYASFMCADYLLHPEHRPQPSVPTAAPEADTGGPGAAPALEELPLEVQEQMNDLLSVV